MWSDDAVVHTEWGRIDRPTHGNGHACAVHLDPNVLRRHRSRRRRRQLQGNKTGSRGWVIGQQLGVK